MKYGDIPLTRLWWWESGGKFSEVVQRKITVSKSYSGADDTEAWLWMGGPERGKNNRVQSQGMGQSSMR